MAAIRFFVQDPGHSGLPEILIVAPMDSDILGNPVVAEAPPCRRKRNLASC